VFAYGVCVGGSARFETVLRPSLERAGLGPVMSRTDQRSIFDAYNLLLDEAVARWPDLEGVVLVHEDVVIRNGGFEDRLREALSAPAAGLVGVVGGRGQTEMSWWKSRELFGHVAHATHVDDYSRGIAHVDAVDGLLMALSPQAARTCRLDGRGYPGFHGYDSELCAVVRERGLRVLVADLDVFHDCKPTDWRQPELWWAAFEWARRWRGGSQRQQANWRLRRDAHRALALARRNRAVAGLRRRRSRALRRSG
jgi:hypothetical protein